MQDIEFPGKGRNETPEEAIIRELKEEINIDVSAACLAPLSFTEKNYENIMWWFYFTYAAMGRLHETYGKSGTSMDIPKGYRRLQGLAC